MVGFLVFWQAAQNPMKKIKFWRSDALTSVQGIILTVVEKYKISQFLDDLLLV
jgi:hypothetical protein